MNTPEYNSRKEAEQCLEVLENLGGDDKELKIDIIRSFLTMANTAGQNYWLNIIVEKQGEK